MFARPQTSVTTDAARTLCTTYALLHRSSNPEASMRLPLVMAGVGSTCLTGLMPRLLYTISVVAVADRIDAAEKIHTQGPWQSLTMKMCPVCSV